MILDCNAFHADLYFCIASLGTYIGKVVSLNTPYSGEGGVLPSIFIPSNERHPQNAACPISVTVAGISINDVSEEQFLNIPPGNLF